ncbi:MAG TPA: hypothetical protein VNX40_11450 [Mucilaginibacter sp.]|jgi:hypothetical protein|nr:hypothetical protein [Mucilaginibacter sp.]
MVIKINRNTKPEDIQKALSKLPMSDKKTIASFYGKLKGAFGDGLKYQKNIRG